MCAAARAPDNPLHSQLKVSRFSRSSSYIYILAVIAILAFTALVELRMGRPPFCMCGIRLLRRQRVQFYRRHLRNDDWILRGVQRAGSYHDRGRLAAGSFPFCFGFETVWLSTF